MSQMPTEEVTLLLHAWRSGNLAALDQLMPLVYDTLHGLAHNYMLRERAGHILQTTALVNEAYVRLVRVSRVDWRDRAHFLAVAATLMRRVLVDVARSEAARKRGGAIRKLQLEEAQAVSPSGDADIVALDEALERLAAVDPRAAKVVEMRFFAGLSVGESAEVLGLSENTVKRDWRAAKLWLLRDLKHGERHGP